MKNIIFINLMVLLIILSGCSPVIKENADTIQLWEQKKSQLNISYNENNYPIKIKNINSKNEEFELTYKKPPQKVVTFWQNSVETLIALGVGDRIVAGTGIPDKKYLRPEYREEYSKIPYTGLQNLDIETITMLEPDFILGWYSTFAPKVAGTTDYWNSRTVNTYIAKSSAPTKSINDNILIKPKHSLDEEYQYILDLGKIFDRKDRANELVGQMKKEISFVTEHTKNINKKPRAIIIEFLGKDISVYGERTLAGDILQRVNGELLEPNVERFSFEQLIDLDPDVIFIVITEQHYGDERMYLDRIYQNKALQGLKAVKNKRIYPVPLYAIYSPGIRAYDGIRIMAQGLYPELYKEK